MADDRDAKRDAQRDGLRDADHDAKECNAEVSSRSVLRDQSDVARDIARDIDRDVLRDAQRDARYDDHGDPIMAAYKEQKAELLLKIRLHIEKLNLPSAEELTRQIADAKSYREAYATVKPVLDLCQPMLDALALWKEGAAGAASSLRLLISWSDQERERERESQSPLTKE